MPTLRSHPRASLTQAMILVAAVALGLAWVKARAYNLRMLHQSFGPSMFYEDEYLSRTGGILGRCWVLAKEWLPCLATLSIALAFMGILSLRPRPGRLSHHPGVVACVAAATILVAGACRACVDTCRGIVANGWVLEAQGHHHRFVWSEEIIPAVSAGEVALGVAASWMVVLLSRRWRIGSGGPDRAGLLIGLLWLAFGLVEGVAPWSFWSNR